MNPLSIDELTANLMLANSDSFNRVRPGVYDATTQYLQASGLLSPRADIDNSVQIGCESIIHQGDDKSCLQAAAGSALSDYLDKMGYARGSSLREDANKAAILFLAKVRKNATSAGLRDSHFRTDSKIESTKSINEFYAPGLRAGVTPVPSMPGQESFGVTMDQVTSDVPAGLAINVAQSNASVVDKLVHRIPQANPYVTFRVEYGQIYDMLQSNDASGDVRNQGTHLKPMISLYHNPAAVSNELQEIVPLQANDTDGSVYKDGYVVANKKVQLFDLSMLANKIGYNHINYTDIVSENVTFDKIVVKLSNGTASADEEFAIDVGQYTTARFMMQLNSHDSSIRQTVGKFTVLLKSTTQTAAGATSALLSTCTATDNIKLDLTAAGQISLKTAEFSSAAICAIQPHSSTGAAVDSAVVTLAGNLTATVVAVKLKAYYSEENMRKSNLAIRTQVQPFAFEVACSRNIMIDWSFNQSQDQMTQDGVIGLGTEATALGVDHRGINIIAEQLKYTYAQNVEAKKDGEFRDVNDRINNTAVAGQIVNPTAMIGTIDLNDLNTIRSSDITGDIREYVEFSLLTKFAQLYQDSLYRLKLNGEKPRFRVLTSPLVLSTVFQVPHIHNHIQQMSEEVVDSEGVTYRRVLNDGTILEFVTCNYNYIRDKIIIIPMVNDEKSVLNFGGNYDCGTFVATYDPQISNGANRRLFTNSRTQVIPTNPTGMYLSVKGLNEILGLDENVGYDESDVLEDPETLQQMIANS